MVNSNKKALGLIFPNSYDNWVPELVNVRLMASIPFASRYRMVDFVLSSMANSGIDNISVIVKKNYHSLMDHLGSGREWDLVRKHGGLNIFPPFMESDSRAYLGRAGALANTLDFLRSQKEKYVVMTDSNIAVNFDFNKMYKNNLRTSMMEDSSTGETMTGWVVIPSKENDPENFVCEFCRETYNNKNQNVDRRILESRNEMYMELIKRIYDEFEDSLFYKG